MTKQSTELSELESKLDRLIESYRAIQHENKLLKDQHKDLLQEQARMLEKTALAKARVEAIITRLRSMEHSS